MATITSKSLLSIILSLAIIGLICAIVCLKQSPKEFFGSYITPTQVFGAVRSGSTALEGAVDYTPPNSECYERCAAGISQDYTTTTTEIEERLQLCQAQCGFL